MNVVIHNNGQTLVNFKDDVNYDFELVMSKRKAAYTQFSDPLYMEAIRKDAAGDTEGAEAARAQALQAVADIKAQYPLPENA